MRLGSLVMSFLLVAVLSGGGLLHALIPHDHSHDAGAVSLIHSSFRHEEQDTAMLPAVVFAFTAVFALLASSVLARAFRTHALFARSRSPGLLALSRGILFYRRFL